MKTRRAILLSMLILLIVAGMLIHYTYFSDEQDVVTTEEVSTTITIWYTDDALTDYINSAAVAYLEEYGVRVVPELHTGLEYLEEIYGASINGDVIPDLYIVGTDSIEKAAMTGLAVPILDERNMVNAMHYPDVALNAVTYHGETFGYPFYYETAFMLYNQSYLREIADANLRKEIANVSEVDEEGDDDSEDENAGTEVDLTDDNLPPEGYSQEEWDILVAEKMNSIIPSSISGMLQFANEFAAPEGVENIFLWDVSDIFYNYFFAGAYMDLGGTYGDDPSIIQIYNDDTVTCMQTYQSLNEYFSIDSKESSYAQVLDSFLTGKTLFMIATTDAVPAIVDAQYQGQFIWDYSVAPLPGVDDEHEATGLSYTNAVLVNGFTEHRSDADSFARFLTNDQIDSLFQRTGKLQAANGTDDYITDATDLARDMYKVSVPLPKLLELSNFWIELELTYNLIWEGADPEASLQELQEKMEAQMNQQ